MDELLPQLLSFPPHPPPPQPIPDDQYDRQIRHLIQVLNQTPANKLLGSVAGGGDLLDILDPSINTLPYLYVLLARSNAAQGSGKQSSNTLPRTSVPGGTLWKKMVDFLERFDGKQIRYAGGEWRRLVEFVAKAARSISEPFQAVQPIKTAILRLDPSAATFTSSHLLLARLCLEANAYTTALPLLNMDVIYFPQRPPTISYAFPCTQNQMSYGYITSESGHSARVIYQDHLEYHLYGALILIALKKWERALDFLELILSSPNNNINAPSTIQIEAYRNWVLVGLLFGGRRLQLPRTVGQQATKTYRAIASPYEGVAEVFKSGTSSRLTEEFRVGANIWRDVCISNLYPPTISYAYSTPSKDGNLGLMRQVLEAHRRFAIINLEKTYSSLSIPEIAKRTSPDPNDLAESEDYIRRLIARGHLFARISQPSDPSKPVVLTFLPSPSEGLESESEAAQHVKLKERTELLRRLDEHVKETDKVMAQSKELIDWQKKLNKSKEAGGAGGSGGMMDMGWDDPIADEDMMADF
ncbi:MAG: hypothetical protein M1812_000022 [Candelaria pacifica]|nr:MAG: hypothetical protein M1812_000022 [Candelaria pacifica]